ncbi:hypothetical protein K402DRAFT_462917 [Aulographum hederae CBS 113979]|uniref:SAP domain-containing protein n=1 Tax=Aulographum hederae CBS 113979 TaxID=1176131 RepID=A0A6G1H2F8_9PEZI|nr:hypothetical protein K402DRAFT_462917 [Aulographum hederae CBS 113979]
MAPMGATKRGGLLDFNDGEDVPFIRGGDEDELTDDDHGAGDDADTESNDEADDDDFLEGTPVSGHSLHKNAKAGGVLDEVNHPASPHSNSGDDSKSDRDANVAGESSADEDGILGRKRITGGRIALPKKITADLDSEDEIILRMKQDGYSDFNIAEKLAQEGRIRYDHKTISTRYNRIKIAIGARKDEQLDAELTDWHEGEDEILIEAMAKAEEVMKSRIQKITDRRFRYVADALHNIKPSVIYSPKACEKRYYEVMNGTAKIPPELDDDPAKRAEEKSIRYIAYLERQQREKTELLAAKERAKLEDERYRLELANRRQAIAEKKSKQVSTQYQKAKAMVERKEKEVAKYRALRISTSAALEKAESAKTSREMAKQRAAEEKRRLQEDYGDMDYDDEETPTGRGRRRESLGSSEGSGLFVSTYASSPVRRIVDKLGDMGPASKTRSRTSSAPNSHKRRHSEANSPPGPRTLLSVSDLSRLLEKRKLPKTPKKNLMLQRLHDYDASLSTAELRQKLSDLGRSRNGPKADLLARIQEAEYENATGKLAPGSSSSVTENPSASKTKRSRLSEAVVADENEIEPTIFGEDYNPDEDEDDLLDNINVGGKPKRRSSGVDPLVFG